MPAELLVSSFVCYNLTSLAQIDQRKEKDSGNSYQRSDPCLNHRGAADSYLKTGVLLDALNIALCLRASPVRLIFRPEVSESGSGPPPKANHQPVRHEGRQIH